jgi:hypothetical protein
MHDDPGLLVEHHDIAILVQNVEGNRFGLVFNRLRFRYADQDLFAGFYPITGFFGLILNQDFLIANQIGRQGAGTIRKVGSDNGIKPPIVVGWAGKDAKGTSDRHAAGQC